MKKWFLGVSALVWLAACGSQPPKTVSQAAAPSGAAKMSSPAPGVGATPPSMSAASQAGPATPSRAPKATLEVQPFGSHPVKVPFTLLAPKRLPFSTYVPADSKLFPGGFQVKDIHVGQAPGVVFGDLGNQRMITEVVFMAQGASLGDAITNLKLGIKPYEASPYGLQFKENTYSQNPNEKPAWIIKEYDGANPKHATRLGTADIGQYKDRYFYILRIDWYEAANIPVMSEWRWRDGSTFKEGAATARS